MRMSDGSSDVCSSDLLRRCGEARTAFNLVCYGLSGRLRGEDDLLQRPFLTRRIIGLVLRIIKLDVRIAGRCILFKARPVDQDIAQLTLFRNREALRSEEHTSELQSLMRISYAVF